MKRVTSFASPQYVNKRPLPNAFDIVRTHLGRYVGWKYSKAYGKDKSVINQPRQAVHLKEMVLAKNPNIGLDYVMRHAQFLLLHPPEYLLV